MGRKQTIKLERREARRVLGEAAINFMNKVSEGTTRNANDLDGVKAAVDTAFEAQNDRLLRLEALVIRPTLRGRLRFLFLGR
jgi:hypothetical protein